MSNKYSASFLSTRSIDEIMSSYWTGFFGWRGTEGRAAGEEDEPGKDPEIGSAGTEVRATGAGLSCTGWMTFPLGDGTDREGLAGPRSERRAWKTYHLAYHGIKRMPLPSAPIVI